VSREEVVVTGLGLITAMARSPIELFERIRADQSLVRHKPDFAEYGLPNPVGAYIDAELWTALGDGTNRPHWMGPHVRLARYAAAQAIRQSGFDPMHGERRGGVFVGSNKNPFDERNLAALARFFDADTGRVNLDGYIESDTHNCLEYFHKRQDIAALVLSESYRMHDVIMTHADACAAGGIAIGSAYRHIRQGELDVALAGAAEMMCRYMPYIGFGVLGALTHNTYDGPETVSRPFSKDRSGFVMGEGSAFLMLESRRHAERRNARILARVAGFSKLAEAWRVTSSPSDGSEYARCMTLALQDAGLTPEGIEHINAHGTSTVANDACEVAAIKQVFNGNSRTIPITANKSATGHALGTSGAMEAVLSILSIEQSMLLPTLNYTAPADDELNFVKTAQPRTIRTVMSNSFGFGGENCSLILQAA
jgi:3-oxoacyl-[acyl-carrier-protein] synthase II